MSFELIAQVSLEFTNFFQAGQYQEAIDSLASVEDKSLHPGKKSYLTGLCYSRLRKYDEAIIHFKKALKEGNSSSDLDYEYGQALYALNKLKEARYQFSKSAGKKFNYIASVYYVAYISELLEDDVMAKYNYGKLIKDGRTDKKILQVSIFQYAKILLKMMRREEESMKTVERNLIRLDINLTNYIPRYILPILAKARDVDPTSEVGIKVELFMRDLIDEFKLDPNTLVNGRKISPNRLYANIALRLKYDDNVNLTKKPSAIYQTEAFTKYSFVVKKRVIIAPELRLTYSKHRDQKTSEIYQNDSFSFSSAVRNKFEHTINSKPASFLLDLEYSSIYKDWKISHRQEFFSKSYSLTIGEQLSLINSGETYFRIRQSGYTDETKISDNKTLSISVEQYAFFKEGLHLMIGTFDLSQLNYYDNKNLSNDVYLARMVYLIFEIAPSYTLQMVFSASLTDTKAQKALRGYELTINPSIDISKAITNKIRLAINFNFIENSSKQSANAYRKKIVGTDLIYTF